MTDESGTFRKRVIYVHPDDAAYVESALRQAYETDIEVKPHYWVNQGEAIVAAAMEYFYRADHNKPPQTKEEFELAFWSVTQARDELRRLVESYDE